MEQVIARPSASISLGKIALGKMWAVVIAGAACLAGDGNAVYQGSPVISAPSENTFLMEIASSHSCPCNLGMPKVKASVSVQGMVVSVTSSTMPTIFLTPGTLALPKGVPAFTYYTDVNCIPPGKCDPKDKSCVPVS